jgi:acyl-CoA hydrolase
VVLCGKVTYVGRTSLEVRVDSYVEKADGSRIKINEAYLVMVALDEYDKPCEVPGLEPETEEEKNEGYQLYKEVNKIHYDCLLTFLDWLKSNFTKTVGISMADLGYLKY